MQVTKLELGEMQTNCYILELSDGQCVLFDIGEDAKTLLRVLERSALKPRAILLTHGHYDHIAGVAAVQRQFGIPVYVHTADVPMLTDSQLNLGDWLSNIPFEPVEKWQTVADGDVLSFGEAEIQVLHTPGHTKGSVCYCCADLLFTGDTLFRLSRGRTDFPGGSDVEMMASFRRLAALSDCTVYPGHGAISTLAFEKAKNPNFRAYC